MSDDAKVVCRVCGWEGRLSHTLRDKNPFDSEDTIMGCPLCKSVNTMQPQGVGTGFRLVRVENDRGMKPTGGKQIITFTMERILE